MVNIELEDDVLVLTDFCFPTTSPTVTWNLSVRSRRLPARARERDRQLVRARAHPSVRALFRPWP